MCGRFAVDKKPEEIAEEVQAEWDDNTWNMPSWNVCPTSYSPVLSEGLLHSWTWGLIPSWSRDDKRRAALINARIETIVEKPSFRNLVGRKQCIIPCDGYYEWLREGKQKIPYYLKRHAGMLLLAGLWDVWKDGTGTEIHSFTVITKEADESIAHIHNRMPVILELEEAKKWSQNSLSKDDALDVSLNELSFHQVSQKVNSVRNNSRDLMEPVKNPQMRQQDLF